MTKTREEVGGIMKPERRVGGNTRPQQIINGAYNQGLADMEKWHKENFLNSYIEDIKKAGFIKKEDVVKMLELIDISDTPFQDLEEIIKSLKKEN